jgi:CRISPR-associated protein Cas2
MWIFVFFDLPTNTKKERRDAALFRKHLEKDGFTMMQYSVYIRYCGSHESMTVHMKRVKSGIPPSGQVSMLTITDKQYGSIQNFWGKIEKKKPTAPQQLEIF